MGTCGHVWNAREALRALAERGKHERYDNDDELVDCWCEWGDDDLHIARGTHGTVCTLVRAALATPPPAAPRDEALAALLREFVESPVEFQDDRVAYVSLQVDASLMDRARAHLAGGAATMPTGGSDAAQG